MFSLGQKGRMDAVWNSSTNGRNNLYSSANLIATGTNDGYVGTPCVPVADFHRKREICSGGSAVFNDGSYNADIIAYEWTFEGGVPSTSTSASPIIQYPNAGRFDVKLKVTSAGGVDSIIKTDYMRVFENESTVPYPFSIDMEDANVFNSTLVNSGSNSQVVQLSLMMEVIMPI